MFELIASQKKERKGFIHTLHGVIKTPAFLPDATYGAVKALSFEDVRNTGIKQILCTPLHLHLQFGSKYIEQLGGLHKFLGWDMPILTDSGGWQVFSLIHQTGKGSVNKDGAAFVMPNTSEKFFLTPEKSIDIQAGLGSDILVALDDPILGDASFKRNKDSVDRTVLWAAKAKAAFLKKYKLDKKKFDDPHKYIRPLLFAVVQGGNYKRLRKECAERLIKIGFDGYGYGGILSRKHRSKTREMLNYFAELIPDEKIRYGMGVGRPEDIRFCIQHGYDLFDSVVPTRNARHGLCYTSFGSINLKNSKYKNDFRPIDPKCDCEACRLFNGHPGASRAYLRSLFKLKEVAVLRLSTIHNLRFYSKLMKHKR